MVKFNAFLTDLPTTKIRILASMGMSIYVIIAAVTQSYTPTIEILGFLLIQMGIDVTQYTIKTKLASPVTTPTVTPPDVPQPKPDLSDLG